MEQRRPLVGAFRHYVRGVFAENSKRARLLLANRARWLATQRPATSAEQRWEGEGGTLR